jgi:hypothetical protein
MAIEYAKDFRWGVASGVTSPSLAGSAPVDEFGQAFAYQMSALGGTIYLKNGEDGADLWSMDKTTFFTTYIQPEFPTMVNQDSYWMTDVLPGGEYFMSVFTARNASYLDTRTFYSLFSMNENAAPTLVRQLYVAAETALWKGRAYLANGETYDDPIIYPSYESSLQNRVHVVPSINEFISGDVSEWWADTTFSPAAKQIPFIRGYMDTTEGYSTTYDMFSLGSGKNAAGAINTFKVPTDGETNLLQYADKKTVAAYTPVPGGFDNDWFGNVVAPVEPQAIIAIPMGLVSAVNHRPTGSSSSLQFPLYPEIDTTTLPSLPDEGDVTLTTAVASTDVYLQVGASATFGDVTFLPIFVVSSDPIDNESDQPTNTYVQYLRIYNYIIDTSNGTLTLDGVVEGILFDDSEFGLPTGGGGADRWLIYDIAPFILPSTGELLLMGTTATGIGHLAINQVFLSGFGLLSFNNRNRRHTYST